MSISSYTLKIKEPCDSLESNNVNFNDDEMVQICLGGLAPRFNTIRSVILTRENPPTLNVQSMLLVEENHVETRGNTSDGQILYMNSDKAREQGHGRRGQSGQG